MLTRATPNVPFVMCSANSLDSICLFPYFLNILLMALPTLVFVRDACSFELSHLNLWRFRPELVPRLSG